MAEVTGTFQAFPNIAAGIKEQDELYSILTLTVDQLELLLEQEEYAAIEFISLGNLSKKQKSEVKTVEQMAGFSPELGNTFELLLSTLGRVPTQQEFADKATEQVHSWWQSSKTVKCGWSETVRAAVYNRQLRSYTSHLVELHAYLALKSVFPEWRIYCSNDIDLLMGVDLIIETEKKRLYIHVFKNSKMGFVSFRKKEQRGGRRNSAGKFVRYKRDFSGHKSLQFDYYAAQCSESTQFINGNPVFKLGYLENQLTMFNHFNQFGEKLSETTQLEYLEQYLQQLEVE